MPREYHWWIGAVSDDGKQVLIYGAPDRGSAGGEDMARSRAFEMLSGMDFELRKLPTRNMGTASALWRGKRLAQGEGLQASLQRQTHERGLSRWKQRRDNRRRSE